MGKYRHITLYTIEVVVGRSERESSHINVISPTCFDTCVTPDFAFLFSPSRFSSSHKTTTRTPINTTSTRNNNMTATILELHGHGDDLLVSTMKDVKVNKTLEEKPEKKGDHQVMGHGDPLFAEVLSHSSPPKKALHSEFLGHGDELLEEVIDHWDDDLKERGGNAKETSRSGSFGI